MDTYKGYGNYGFIPITAAGFCKAISQLAGPTTLEKYLKLVMITLMNDFERRLAQRKVTASIIQLFHLEFQRILSEMKEQREAYYLPCKDQFLKDLAICRLKLYPCGAELIDELSGVPRSIMINKGLSQFSRSLPYFLFNLKGFRPVYEMHMHAPLKTSFNVEGWNQCFKRICELLLINPDIKGVSCVSWWYDPALETISPRLAYLRQQPLEGGARIFFVATDKYAKSGAIEKSKTRRKLYERGQYCPKLFLMIWSRDDLIRWASK